MPPRPTRAAEWEPFHRIAVMTGCEHRAGRVSGRAMASQDQYQQRASECFRFAEQSGDEKERNAWRQLALCWLRLCEHAEGFGRVSMAA
jgi:hypothetical protein